ncbi:MAG TPA: TetR/AcrR family transcriptional regulator [Gammaproteobacteria bacterium]|nr:TetR/AcrR family transcriptional regulator [Gammaproteobacteria bacterium]
MTKRKAPSRRKRSGDEEEVRGRILDAAFMAFKENGYAVTSTLEIATRARVSKRELYALVGNKEEMLKACVTRRAKRLQASPELPLPRDRETLEKVLVAIGTQQLREVSAPPVVAVFRLAIGEAIHAPEVARILRSIGIETARAALREFMTRALESKLLEGEAEELAEQFNALLWGYLMMDRLLGMAEQPAEHELAARARAAVTVFLRLHHQPRP